MFIKKAGIILIAVGAFLFVVNPIISLLVGGLGILLLIHFLRKQREELKMHRLQESRRRGLGYDGYE